jgi:hypothetical protein
MIPAAVMAFHQTQTLVATLDFSPVLLCPSSLSGEASICRKPATWWFKGQAPPRTCVDSVNQLTFSLSFRVGLDRTHRFLGSVSAF